MISLERVRALLPNSCLHIEKLLSLMCGAERGREESVVRFGCYLDGQLELLVFPLQLLCFRQRAGIDQAGVEHRFSIADPSQDLGSWDKNIGEWPLWLPKSCCLLWWVLQPENSLSSTDSWREDRKALGN